MTLASGSGMVYEGMLPLLVEPVATPPAPAQLVAVNDGNELLLTNVLGFDEKRDTNEHDEVLQEIRRQDQKLRLALDLLAMLLMQNKLLPEAALLRFSGEQLAAPAAAHPTLVEGQSVKCSLYLDPTLPKPLVIFATAHGGTEPGPDGEPWMTVSFTSLNQAVQDQLEKFVFRQHRRMVAQQRRH